jgi:hypothetical protein
MGSIISSRGSVETMARSTTCDALLEHGALLFARHGVAGVTARQLHEAIGARNERSGRGRGT